MVTSAKALHYVQDKLFAAIHEEFRVNPLVSMETADTLERVLRRI